MTASLSLTLLPPRITTYGVAGLLGQTLQHLELAQDQPAGVVRQPGGQLDDRGVGTVHRTERVVDVGAG